jgi:hypothetical protein
VEKWNKKETAESVGISTISAVFYWYTRQESNLLPSESESLTNPHKTNGFRGFAPIVAPIP